VGSEYPKKASLLFGLTAFGMLVWLSCQGDGAGLTEAGDLDTSVQSIFNSKCVHCHSPGGDGYNDTGGEENGLDLSSGGSLASLVNQPTFWRSDTAPRWRVLPGEPDSSYLIQKVETGELKSGLRMPADGPPYLSASEIQLLRSWIEDGAPGE